jgi:hypothetical protein
VNELSVGYRHSTEAGSALTQEGLDAVTRNHIGYTLGQFSPSINPLNIIPSASFTGAIANPAAITFEGRFPLTGADTFVTVNDTASLRVEITRSRLVSGACPQRGREDGDVQRQLQ